MRVCLIFIVFMLSCFPAILRGEQRNEVAFSFLEKERSLEIATLPADGFECEITVEPGRFARKGEVALVFSSQEGSGFRAVVKPHAGGVMLERIGPAKAHSVTIDRRNPTMNLAEGDYTFRLPFRLKVLAGNGKAQLYLGFHGLPPDFLHGEIDYSGTPPVRLEVRALQAEVRCSELKLRARTESIPDSTARASIRGPMPTWSQFVGTHYLPRPPFHLYRGLFYEPIIYRRIANASERPESNLRPWVAYVDQASLPPGCEEREGPYSGKKVWIDVERVRQMLSWAEANDAVLLHGRDILKRTEYVGAEEIALRKDELYWSVRILYEIAPKQAASRVKLQLGNEVNAFHVPWKNHPDLIRRYVEYNFAPAAEAIRHASQDVLGAPDRIPFLMGSVTSPWPLANGWLMAMAHSRIEGDWAPSLKGKSVMSLACGASTHYAMKGPFWSQALDAVYQRLAEPTEAFEFWSTEEVGGNADINRGPYVAAIPFRYLDWWSRRAWKPGRGGVIYWGDTRGGQHYTTAMDVQELLGSFFANHPLRNETDALKIQGSPDIEAYAFATTGDGPGRVGIAVMSKDYWFFPDVVSSGLLAIKRGTLAVPSFREKKVATAWYRVTDERIELVKRMTAEAGAAGELPFPDSITLDRAHEEILLGFAALADEPTVAALHYTPPVKELTRLSATEEVESFHLGNDLAVDLGGELTWTMLSDGGKAGRRLTESAKNIDAGMAGDHHGLTVDRRIHNELSFALSLQRGISTAAGELQFDIRGDPLEVWWDGKRLAGEVSPAKPVISMKETGPFSPGPHVLRLINKTGQSSSIDSLTFRETVSP